MEQVGWETKITTMQIFNPKVRL